MDPRQRNVVLLVVGVLLLLISAAADHLGLGSAPGMGWKQIVGMLVGLALAAVGAAGLRDRRS